MDVNELLGLEPTVSEYTSETILLEVVHKEDWRCYASRNYEGASDLAERFLKYHATVPGFVSDELRAKKPVEVFFFVTGDESSAKGGLFKNGAVLVAHSSEGQDISLFIDDASAQRLNYPDEGFVYLSDVREEEAQD